MPRTAIPIFGLGNPARSPFISTVDRLNCIVEPSDNGRQPTALLGLPGLVRQATLGVYPIRGLFLKKGDLSFYVAVGNLISLIQPNGVIRTIATLTTDSGPVWMDENGTQLGINDGSTFQVYTYATGTTQMVTDIDYQTGARGCTFLEGRFWVYLTTGVNAGKCYASDQYNGLSWDALNFITPAARPTGITGIDRWYADLVIRGQGSIEWWSGNNSQVSGALGFQPSSPANTEVGSLSERGSAKVGQQFFFVGGSGGTSGVYEMSGYQITKVSTPAVDVALSQRQIATAICTGYVVYDHSLFQITIPAQSSDEALTLIYDATTGLWSSRSSAGLPYYRGLLAVNNSSTVFITDAFTGSLYRMDEQTYDEDGQIMEYQLTSSHMLKEGDGFAVDGFQVDMETGLGNPMPPGDDPHGMLQVSKDGGHTWCMERSVSLGKMGTYTTRAQEYQFGWARDWAFRFSITDPIPRRVTGAYLLLQPGYA